MGEVVFVAAILLLLIGAMGFYFYSRMLYNEKKMNLLETILLDIKMMMEMEDQAPPLLPPKKEHVIIGAPEMVQAAEVEELKTEDSGYYAGVIESAAKEEPVATAETVDYEALSRDELAALAEKRSLRVTKRMNRQTLLTVLRESDKNTSVPQEQEQVDGSAQLGAIDGEDIATEAAI